MFSWEQILKFLEANGLQGNIKIENHREILEILDKVSGEKLAYKEEEDFFSYNDGKTSVTLYPDSIMLDRNNIRVSRDRKSLSIYDFETRDQVDISYIYNSTLNDLGSIKLVAINRNFEKECEITLIQGVFDTKILNISNKGLETNTLQNEKEELYYTEQFLFVLEKNGIITSNPKIKEKLGVMATFIQEYINVLVNAKYEDPNHVINLLERKKLEITKEIDKLNNYKEQADIIGSPNNTTGKKM